jgi:hypothetical protein
LENETFRQRVVVRISILMVLGLALTSSGGDRRSR